MAALAQLSIAPTSQTVSNAGNSATYVLTITNPTASSQQFVPSVPGGSVNPSWGLQLPASVIVPANSMQTFNLTLVTPSFLTNGTYPFTESVSTIGGLNFSTSGTIIIGAPGTPGTPSTPAPPSLILAFLGLAGLGIYAACYRLKAGMNSP
jgi:hypothetical protein